MQKWAANLVCSRNLMLPWKPEELGCPTAQKLRKTAVLSRRNVVSVEGKVVSIKRSCEDATAGGVVILDPIRARCHHISHHADRITGWNMSYACQYRNKTILVL